MRRNKNKCGFTLVETLMVIGIVACICVMLFPAIQSARENTRRATCVNNMKTLGLAIQQYADIHDQIPPSSGVTRNSDKKIIEVDGWSWEVLILPYFEENQDQNNHSKSSKMKLYESLDIKNGRPLQEPVGAEQTPHAAALATTISELICPSYSGNCYVDPKTQKAAITNYKAMGATHIESLSIASPSPLIPKYRPESNLHSGWSLLSAGKLAVQGHRGWHSVDSFISRINRTSFCTLDGGGGGCGCRIASER